MNRAKTSATILAGFAVTLLSTFATAPLSAAILRANDPIPDSYIVVLRDDWARPDRAQLGAAPRLPELARDLAAGFGGRADRTFTAALEGFSFTGTLAAAEALARDPRVAYVAEDGWVGLASVQTPTPSWGLDRIDQGAAPLDNSYTYNADGLGIDIYILDTGIRSTHQEFGNRVDTVDAYSTVADDLGTEDCQGHGTMVAGVAAGSTYGVAKSATLHPVRVLDCYGQGAISHMIAGIDWITAHYPISGNPRKPSPPTRAVVNISLNAGFSQPLDDAVARSIAAGVTYVVAAGNDGDDACYASPARAAGAITVAASDGADARPSWSNFGTCVEIFAPGSSITTSYFRSDSDSLPFSGTSAAAPHVAGTVALMLADNPNLKPSGVTAALLGAATPNLLTNVGEGSPNLLLYSAFAGSGADLPPTAAFSFTCSNRDCAFNATASADDAGIVSYRWNFGDGRTGKGVKASHRYQAPTSTGIVVTLTVTDTSGQTAVLSRSLDGAW